MYDVLIAGEYFVAAGKSTFMLERKWSNYSSVQRIGETWRNGAADLPEPTI
jgi:hypothetical protein